MATVRSGDRTDRLRTHTWRSLLGSRSGSAPPSGVVDAVSPANPTPDPPAEALDGDPADDPAPPRSGATVPAPRPGSYPVAGWHALGSQVNLIVADRERLEQAGSLSRGLLDQIDRTSSRRRPDADLARANRAAGRWVRVDPLLTTMVASAVRVAKGTAGLVDPAVRPAGAPLPGAWEQIEFDPDGGLKVPAGVQLDLGAMNKAFAADSIADRVSRDAGTSLVVCIGGAVAVGNLPGEDHRWQITVHERPRHPGRYPSVNVVLAEGALSTTAARTRKQSSWETSPSASRTTPARVPDPPVWRTASVCAATCVDAVAASSAAVTLGEQAPAWLWQRSLAARLVTPAGVVLRIAGWPS